jgi:hypothetical protein
MSVDVQSVSNSFLRHIARVVRVPHAKDISPFEPMQVRPLYESLYVLWDAGVGVDLTRIVARILGCFLVLSFHCRRRIDGRT